MKREFRSNTKLNSEIIKTIASLFDPAPNSEYNSFDLARALIKMGMNNSSAERRSRPSPDVILRRTHQVDEGEAREKFENLNEKLLKHLPLPENPIIAIDFTTYPYYGEEDPLLVSDSRLPGTSLGIKFAVLSIVEKNMTVTLRVVQVGPLESKVSVLRKLLNHAEELLDPGLVLLDRGFYSVEAIREFKSRKQGFIMPAKRTNRIKKVCDDFANGNVTSETKYTVSSQTGEEEVKLILTEKGTEGGTEIHSFITNREFSPEKVSENYGWRWRVETNIREFEKFRPLTTSQSMELRRLYFLIAMTLYNFWILTRNGSEHPRAYQFKQSLKFELKVRKILGKETRPPPVPALA